jgi:hypothetical protein
MTSERKIAANRINAGKSCGPRSPAAKARVKNNALRHGLAAVRHLDSRLAQQVGIMARAICGDDVNPLLLEQAVVIAECETLLSSVRAERVAAIERLRDIRAIALAKADNSLAVGKERLREMELAADEFEQLKAKFDAMPAEEQEKVWDEYEETDADRDFLLEERDEFDAMREAMLDLNRLERYQRRAWSRRKRAFRRFMAIKSNDDGAEGPP